MRRLPLPETVTDAELLGILLAGLRDARGVEAEPLGERRLQRPRGVHREAAPQEPEAMTNVAAVRPVS